MRIPRTDFQVKGLQLKALSGELLHDRIWSLLARLAPPSREVAS